jgi:hypothetical protein
MLIILLLPLMAFAHVLQDDVLRTGAAHFNLPEVCQRMFRHEAPLIEVVNGTQIDCMGKKLSVPDFCEKALAHDPYLIRGYVSKTDNKVHCISGKKVVFKYLCAKRTPHCLAAPEQACQQLRSRLARRLEVVSASFTKDAAGIKQLNCYYGSELAQLDVTGGEL